MSGAGPAGGLGKSRRRSPISHGQRVQIGVITLVALALIFVLNRFSKRAPLSPLDFAVGGPDAIQFCDPSAPRFLPVVSKRSPVVMRVEGGTLWLRTAGGKPIGKDDLQPTQGRPMRLFVVASTLDAFAELAPAPAPRIGEWIFSMKRDRARSYRAFADFTPKATGREMYASAEVGPATEATSSVAEPGASGGFDLAFTPLMQRVYARQAVALSVRIRRADGGAVQALSGPADLIGFDRAVTGLLEIQAEPFPPRVPESGQKELSLTFRPTFADPGRYVLWAEIPLSGKMLSARLALDVLP